MNRSKYIMVAESLIYGIVILYLCLISVPIMDYALKPEMPLKISVQGTSQGNQDPYRWVAKHLKIQESNEAPDILVVKNALSDYTTVNKQINHNLVMGENLFSGNGVNQINREWVTHVFNVKTTDFIGKTYQDLSFGAGISEKIVKSYESEYHSKWAFAGPGIVLIRDTQVIVLQKGVDYKTGLSLVSKNDNVLFNGWFEVVETPETVEKVFKLDVTSQGQKVLDSLGIKAEFPAQVKRVSPLYRAEYFAGDMSNLKIAMPYFYSLSEWVILHKGIYDTNTNEFVFWKSYYNPLKALINERVLLKNEKPSMSQVVKDASFAIHGTAIVKQNRDGSQNPFYIHGVNLGTALPGKFFTEMPESYDLYLEWLQDQSDMNVNTIRLYTLLPPAFYKALYDFNESSQHKIYLLQEIWPEEHPESLNYWGEAYHSAYQQEIKNVVGAVHGDCVIGKRDYRAHGVYAYDVSPYLIGYLVGRELEPEEVLETNRLNANHGFNGEFFYTEKGASASEAWLAASCDFTLKQENERYGNLPLVAIVNWPPLDVIEHESGWQADGLKKTGTNDLVSININQISMQPGKNPLFFGAYHIYPNYPDFINEDSEYGLARDSDGQFRYKGYLEAFIETHKKYPAIVAEYGLSNSMATAHVSPDGLNHGGLNEWEQARGTIRMAKSIRETGYAGAIVFQWMDEWAKKTWTMEPFMVPYERHVLWQNVMDPEQNYGIIAVESKGYLKTLFDYPRIEGVNHLRIRHNYAFIEIELTLNESFEKTISTGKPLKLGISTFEDKEEYIPEFELILSDKPQIKVLKAYNWTKNRFVPNQSVGGYENLELLTNNEAYLKNGKKFEKISVNLSDLNVGSFKNSKNSVEIQGNKVKVRLPYTLLGISDPSSLTVLNDSRSLTTLGQNAIVTSQTEGITVQLGSHKVFYGWSPWETVDYMMRPKAAYEVLKDYFSKP